MPKEEMSAKICPLSKRPFNEVLFKNVPFAYQSCIFEVQGIYVRLQLKRKEGIKEEIKRKRK